MKGLITIREYALLTTAPVEPSLDLAQITASAFDWLCELNSTFKKGGATLLQVDGRRSLKWDSYVGVVETPCGTRLEILPKHVETSDCKKQSRALLRKMIQALLNIKPREVSSADLELFDAPLSEWVMQQFLSELALLVKRGVRFDYHRIEEEQSFLRGQLNIVAQMRQPPGRQHRFQIRHNVFLPNCAENRLLKLALLRVAKTTQSASNWQLASELRAMLAEVPASQQVATDIPLWRQDRLMGHYQTIKPWCELILNQQMPIAVAGTWHGMSLLFPMETLFEKYVVATLRRNLQVGVTLTSPARSEYLCSHDNSHIFRLEPDLVLSHGDRRWVLDTKWKRLNKDSRKTNYDLNRSDFYQMNAYGHQYLDSQGEMILVYPRWHQFQNSLPTFDFGKGLTVQALPFDLELACLIDIEQTSLPLVRQTTLSSPYNVELV